MPTNLNISSPYLSILIPVYNVEPYLKVCLDSINRQNLSGIEVICLDDCSTDRSLQVLRDYKINRMPTMRIIELDQNGGLANARNVLLSEASGEYIWFIDSDDWIVDSAIDAVKPYIDQGNYDVILFDMLREKKAGNLKQVTCFSAKPEALIASTEALITKTFESKKLFAWLRIFKRDIWHPDLTYPTGKFFEDVYVIPKLMSLCRTGVYIDTALYFYRDNSQGIMATPNVVKIQDLSRSLCSMLSFWEKHDYSPSESVIISFRLFAITNYLGAHKMLRSTCMLTPELNAQCFSHLLDATQASKGQLVKVLLLNGRFKHALRLYRYAP